jgi:hypothetical protein
MWIGNVAAEDTKDNWMEIESNSNWKVEAEVALWYGRWCWIKARIEAELSMKRWVLKSWKMRAEALEAMPANPKQQMRNVCNFWRKSRDDRLCICYQNNILGSLPTIWNTVENNKDAYTSWGTKLNWCMKLTDRKNTVEKEGLTSDDNRKIAGL